MDISILGGHAPSLTSPLTLDVPTLSYLFRKQGPSLGLWRGAEIAMLRRESYPVPVLDLGCGDGLVSSMVLKSIDYGIDPDKQALARASQTGAYRTVEACCLTQCSVPDGTVGTILSNSVLEHLPDLSSVLIKARRLLRPNGRLIFTVPTEVFPKHLFLPVHRYQQWRVRYLTHLNMLTEEQWRHRLENAGLETEAVLPYMRGALVRMWDMMELAQLVQVRRRRLFGIAWRRLPGAAYAAIAKLASNLDLSSPKPGGGRLIVARRTF